MREDWETVCLILRCDQVYICAHLVHGSNVKCLDKKEGEGVSKTLPWWRREEDIAAGKGLHIAQGAPAESLPRSTRECWVSAALEQHQATDDLKNSGVAWKLARSVLCALEFNLCDGRREYEFLTSNNYCVPATSARLDMQHPPKGISKLIVLGLARNEWTSCKIREEWCYYNTKANNNSQSKSVQRQQRFNKLGNASTYYFNCSVFGRARFFFVPLLKIARTVNLISAL